MLIQRRTKHFTRDIRRMESRGKDVSKLNPVIDLLCKEEPLPEKYRDHALKGDWEGYRECHIEPNWLLVYKIEKDRLVLVLTRTGSHNDIF